MHQGVYCFATHEVTFEDRLRAARLALPAEARTTGITRIQELGIAYGPTETLHFVVAGDLHLTQDGVFLHRTVKMPPADEYGVCAEAALASYAADERVIDVIKVGCELLRRGLLDIHVADQLIAEERWRRGVKELAWVLPCLDGRCRSVPEAELLTLIRFAGLPEPEVNTPLQLGTVELTPDVWFRLWKGAVEYEGAQHQTSRAQYTGDIDRYALMRRHGIRYLQVTRELLRLPTETVRRVHQLLVDGGYDGPAPVFGREWSQLFEPLRCVVRAAAAEAVAEESSGWREVS